jgi:tRNA (guanine-N7-)-methyltransferase
MPLRFHDPFADRAARLNTGVNPYVQLLRDATATGELAVAHGPMLKEHTGKWRAAIDRFYRRPASSERRPLFVEIGCHKGLTLTAMAAAHPEADFIGIDITFKRVVTTAQRAKKAGLANVYCVMANAVGIDQLFGEGEIDGLVVFFPDPWIKKKSQAKNRLIDAAFCERLSRVLAPHGTAWLKTDQELYYSEASAAFAATGFKPAASPVALFTETYSSAFETRFTLQNLPTFGGQWQRDIIGSNEH